MSQGYDFYIERAEESAADARAALLDNVRDRALRSEATWRKLAAQAEKVAAERVKAEKAKAEARAAQEELESEARQA